MQQLHFITDPQSLAFPFGVAKDDLISQFSGSVASDSLQHHGLQHVRPPCPLPAPGVYSNSNHWVGDATQPSHPRLSSSLSTFNLSQNQGLFKWVSSSHEVTKVLEFQLYHQSFQWIFSRRTDVEVETPILGSPDVKNWLIWKDSDAGKDWRWEKGKTDDEMVVWHHQLDGLEFE